MFQFLDIFSLGAGQRMLKINVISNIAFTNNISINS